MTISPSRLALGVAALVVLGAIGGGLVEAAVAPPAANTDLPTASAVSSAEDAAGLLEGLALAADPGASGAAVPAQLLALRDRLEGRFANLRGHVVHGTLTVVDRDGKLVNLQLDHGTLSAVGGGSITIAEAGGSRVTVATTVETRVREDRKPATLTGLKVGDEVVVTSTVAGGSATARLIVVPPPGPAAAAPSQAGNG
ncbi:MAG TPA: hypothetical protein VKC59_02335 [Candidatus Limnocylindrales bacterium]|nr:hypothetical protein [Candidatus Limnocylindrales bacterium]